MTHRGDLLLLFIRLKHKTARLRSAHESDTLNVDDEVLRKRMEKSIAVHDENHEPMMVNEADMDFRIPGLPHSVEKFAQSTSVRQLILKIENRPDQHALQKDPRQNQTFFPFSPESQQVIRDVGNIESSELLETEPKTQCKVCILEHWHRLLHVRALPAQRKRGESAIHQVYDGPSFNFRSTSSRKDDFMDIDMVKSWETRNTIALIS